MEKRIQQALTDLKIPVHQRIAPNTGTFIIHRTKNSVLETFDHQKVIEEQVRVGFIQEREGKGFRSPKARPYRPLGELQSLDLIYTAIKKEIKLLENPAGIGDGELQRLPYLSLGYTHKKGASSSLPTSTSPPRGTRDGTPVRRFFKQEIADSYQRMRNVKAGKALQSVIPERKDRFLTPDVTKYSDKRLGTPSDVSNGALRHRRKFFSLYDSSPQRKYLALPSLLDLVHQARRLQDQHSDNLPLPDRIQTRLNHIEQTRSFRRTQTKGHVSEAKKTNNFSFSDTNAALSAVFEERGENQVLSTTRKLHEVVDSLETSKTMLERQLETDLTTLRYDRPDAISLKQKHFRVSPKGTNAQTMVLDLERMRIRAEIERISLYQSLAPHFQWYKSMLALVINENPEITPVTYYLMDGLKAIIESGCEEAESAVMEMTAEARKRDNGANKGLIGKVLEHWGLTNRSAAV